jgi:hypothetical protein
MYNVDVRRLGHIDYNKIFTILRRLVAGFSRRRPEFAPGSIRVGFVVDKVALEQRFLPDLFGFFQYNFTIFLATHISCGV